MFQDKKQLALFLVSFVLFLSPALLRAVEYSPENIIGFTTYFHVRMSEIVSSGSLYDPLSYGGRSFTYPPGFPALLALFPGLLKLLVNPLAGSLFSVMFYDYCKKRLGARRALYSWFFLLTIPGFIYLSSHINPRLIAMLLIFSVYYLRSEQKPSGGSLGLQSLLLFASALVHPLVFTVGLVLLLVSFRGRRELLLAAVPGILSIAASLLMHGLPAPSPVYENFVELQKGVQYFLFESGAAASSASVVTWIIGLAGWLLYHKKHPRMSAWLVFSVSVPLLFGNRLNEFIYYPLAFFAALGFSRMERLLSEFRIPVNARLVRVLAVVYLLVIAAVYPLIFSRVGPPRPDYAVLSWARENLPEDAVVFSGFAEGHWVTSIAERKSFWDAYVEYAPNVTDRYFLALKAFNGYPPAFRRMECEYNVSYVYVHAYPYDERFHTPLLSFLEQNAVLLFQAEDDSGRALIYRLQGQNC